MKKLVKCSAFLTTVTDDTKLHVKGAKMFLTETMEFVPDSDNKHLYILSNDKLNKDYFKDLGTEMWNGSNVFLHKGKICKLIKTVNNDIVSLPDFTNVDISHVRKIIATTDESTGHRTIDDKYLCDFCENQDADIMVEYTDFTPLTKSDEERWEPTMTASNGIVIFFSYIKEEEYTNEDLLSLASYLLSELNANSDNELANEIVAKWKENKTPTV